ncbi:MAG: hypothetical protein HYU29_05020 [Chloroflexi bacterium]|nr:hypothetical protein [Chloroflexota bacterium]
MPPKLEWSKYLGRKTRTEPVEEQGVLTWDLVREAILQGKTEEALEWLRYIKEGENYVKPSGGEISPARTIWHELSYIVETYGEEHVEKALRWWRRKLIEAGHEPTYDMSPLERLQYHAEMERADYSGPNGRRFDVTEEADRYVMELNPCGSCGRLRRAEAEAKGLKLGKTSKAYPWSWGKANVPYLCAYNCLWWEVMSIEDIGYPVKVYEWSEDPYKPCRVYFYKDPLKVPEQYFTRVGKKRDPSRFKK